MSHGRHGEGRISVVTMPALALGLALVATACGGAGASGSPAPRSAAAADPSVVTVTLTDAGCVPDRGSVAPGPVTFRVVNDGGARVSELELLQGDRVLGEKENLTAGLSGTFTLELAAGDYTLECPGAVTPETAFQVSGS